MQNSKNVRRIAVGAGIIGQRVEVNDVQRAVRIEDLKAREERCLAGGGMIVFAAVNRKSEESPRHQLHPLPQSRCHLLLYRKKKELSHWPGRSG